MQDRKEELTEFVKTIKNKVHDWWVSYPRKLWTARIFVYDFLLLVVIFVGAVTFAHFNLFHTDVNSARYMLSALVQSQAAIVAIVITLTLIAVQLTASAYSPRVIDIFKKNPDMWILLSCYGVSIFSGFIVLKLVEGAEGEAVSQTAIWSLGYVSISFEFCVSLAYWLGAFTFVALFPYMLDIISLLKSENIIKRLAIAITKGKLLKPEEDPIQPIMDIIHGSIMKYDLETTRVGLKAVTEQVLEIISPDDEVKISEHFCQHLRRVSGLAISREDEESTREVIENLEKFAKSAGGIGTGKAAFSIRKVGITAAENKLKDATWEAAFSLGIVGIRATEEDGFAGGGHQAAGVTQQVALSLEKVGMAAVENELNDATKQATMSLLQVGRRAEIKRFSLVIKQAAESLAKLTILNEEIVKTAIQNYESNLGEQDRDSFQKFMKIYEQELEKLRAEKRAP